MTASADPPTAVYMDGTVARACVVSLIRGRDELIILENGRVLARWSLAGLTCVEEFTEDLLRLRSAGHPEARLDIRRSAWVAIGVPLAPSKGTFTGQGLDGPLALPLCAVAGLLLILAMFYLLPALAGQALPLVSISVEQRLGRSSVKKAETSEDECRGQAGANALTALAGRLALLADLPVTPEVRVISGSTETAVALMGGRVYIFEGLLQSARTPDELAGVLAHEFGHVAHRDGLRAYLQTSGSHFLLAILLNDMVGGSTMGLLPLRMSTAAESRASERRADEFAGRVLLAAGGSPHALGQFLQRMSEDEKEPPLVFASHPPVRERASSLKDPPTPRTGAALMSSEEWRALKTICSEN